jgi:hypothetical protein
MHMESALVLYSGSHNKKMTEPVCPGDGEEHAAPDTVVGLLFNHMQERFDKMKTIENLLISQDEIDRIYTGN